MSQHYYQTSMGDRTVLVTLGWDRPMGHFFMVVERVGDDPTTDSDDDGIVYSNLSEVDAFELTLADYKKRLDSLQIQVPQAMFDQVELDSINRVGNRCVQHEPDGSFRDLLAEPQASAASSPGGVREEAPDAPQ